MKASEFMPIYKGINTYEGHITYEGVAEAFNLPYTPFATLK